MKKLIPLLFLALLLPATAFAQVKAEDKTCQSDADCTTVVISCNGCCPSFDPNEVAAVTTGKEKDYAQLGVCTQDHIKNCGVPECGMMPTPYPVATCQQGVCTVMMHAPDPRPGDTQQPNAPLQTPPQAPPAK
jgi:hypothetical protein